VDKFSKVTVSINPWLSIAARDSPGLTQQFVLSSTSHGRAVINREPVVHVTDGLTVFYVELFHELVDCVGLIQNTLVYDPLTVPALHIGLRIGSLRDMAEKITNCCGQIERGTLNYWLFREMAMRKWDPLSGSLLPVGLGLGVVSDANKSTLVRKMISADRVSHLATSLNRRPADFDSLKRIARRSLRPTAQTTNSITCL
jgi:hypothetical protein